MKCLWQYINNNSQAQREEPSAEKKEAGGSDRILDYHSFIAYLIIKVVGGSNNNKYGNGKGH